MSDLSPHNHFLLKPHFMSNSGILKNAVSSNLVTSTSRNVYIVFMSHLSFIIVPTIAALEAKRPTQYSIYALHSSMTLTIYTNRTLYVGLYVWYLSMPNMPVSTKKKLLTLVSDSHLTGLWSQSPPCSCLIWGSIAKIFWFWLINLNHGWDLSP